MNRAECAECGATFCVDQEDLYFYERVSPRVGRERLSVPPPRRCPDCRLRRRLSFRNQIHVYLSRSSRSGAPVFAMYPAEAPFPVWTREEWWGDDWDGLSTGREFDFHNQFFPQFRRLQLVAPVFPLSSLNPENSDYCNNVTGVKNC